MITRVKNVTEGRVSSSWAKKPVNYKLIHFIVDAMITSGMPKNMSPCHCTTFCSIHWLGNTMYSPDAGPSHDKPVV